MGRRLHPEVERAIEHVVGEAMMRRKPSASAHYPALVGLVTALGRPVPSYGTFQRRFASARARAAAAPRLAYAVHHERLDILVPDQDGRWVRPLVTFAVCIDVGGDRAVPVASKVEVSVPSAGRDRPPRARRRTSHWKNMHDRAALAAGDRRTAWRPGLLEVLASVNAVRNERGRQPIPPETFEAYVRAAERLILDGPGG